MKLTSIENLRKDGKFYDDRGHIPEGTELLMCGCLFSMSINHVYIS